MRLFANLRPAICFAELVSASSLKAEIISGSGHSDSQRAYRRNLFWRAKGN